MKKFSWGHGIALALALFIGFILYLIFIFPIGKQNSELVTESYYEDELEYQKVIDAKKNAESLPAKPQYAQLPEGIKITFPSEIVNANSSVDYYLYRTNDKTQDLKGSITLDQNNSFTLPKKVLINGNYTLKVKWKKDNKEYQVDYDLEWK